MLSYNGAEPIYAGFWVRLAAFGLDCGIVFVLKLVARLVLFLNFGLFWESDPLDSTLLFQYSWKDGLIYAVGALYFILCTWFFGATIGKRAMNLQVIGRDGVRFSLIDVIFRETAGRFLSAVLLGMGYLLVGITVEKTALHDLICDTRVVYAKKIPTFSTEDFNRRYVHVEHPSRKEELVPSSQTDVSGACTDPEPFRQENPAQDPDRVICTEEQNISIYYGRRGETPLL